MEKKEPKDNNSQSNKQNDTNRRKRTTANYKK